MRASFRAVLFTAACAAAIGSFVACGSSSSGPSATDDAGPFNTGDSGGSQTDSGGTTPKDSGSGPADAGVDAQGAAPRYVGRTRASGDAGVDCNWSGCRAIARFAGTAASIDIGGPGVGTSVYDVLVDGKPAATPITVVPATTTYPLATGLPAGVHTVEIFKRSEADDGIETFKGFTFPGGGVMLAPPAPGAHLIEFIGDSITAGFGMLGAPANCDTQPVKDTVTNARLSFAGIIASTLSADAIFVAYSGKGVTRNFALADTQLIFGNPTAGQDLYDMTTVSDTGATWGFKPPVDAVVLALGADDFNNPGVGAAPSQAAFQAAYKAFLLHIRAKYPSAFIFATYSPSTVDQAAPNNGLTVMTAAIPAAIAAITPADPKLFFIDGSVNLAPTPADATGCDNHPNAGYHAKVGASMAAYIKMKAGW